MRNHLRAPRTYELLTILTPEVPEEEIAGALDRIAAAISSAGGTVTETLHESPWGRRRLAYAIRHAGRDVRDGYYTLFHFELDPGKMDDVERDLRLNDNVIRHLVTLYTPRPVEETDEEAPASEAKADGEAAAPAAEAQAAEAEKPEVAEATAPDEPAAATEAATSEATVAEAEPATAEEPVAEAETESAESAAAEPEAETDAADETTASETESDESADNAEGSEEPEENER